MRGRTNVGVTASSVAPDAPLDPLNLVFTEHLISTIANLVKVIYAGGYFVAVGYMGTIAFSQNGVDWVVRGIDKKYDLYDVIYANGAYTVVGGQSGNSATGTHNAVIAQSTNLIDWAVVNDTLSRSDSGNHVFAFTGVAYDGVKYVLALVDSYTNSFCVASGTDLSSLTLGSALHGSGSSSDVITAVRICYANSRYVISGGIPGATMYSVDGITWTGVKPPPGGSGMFGEYLTYCNGIFVMSSRSCIYFSRNGAVWEDVEQGDRRIVRLLGVLYINGQYLLLDGDFFNDTQSYFTVSDITSGDQVYTAGVTYLPRNVTMRSMACGNDKIVLVGDGGIAIATDTPIKDRTLTVNPSIRSQSLFLQRKDNINNLEVKPVTSAIDLNIRPENIKSGVTILGVTGTL